MTGYHKFRSPESNTTSPAFIARWEAHRAAIRPAECDGARGAPCWVTAPYDAISANNRKPSCTGCGGAIVPVGRGAKFPGFWPEPVKAILERLEEGEA